MAKPLEDSVKQSIHDKVDELIQWLETRPDEESEQTRKYTFIVNIDGKDFIVGAEYIGH